MQPSAGPDLPHTDPRPIHWVATAAALAGVTALAALIQPPDASAAHPGGGGQQEAPDPAEARYPMDCGPRTESAVSVLAKGSADFDGDGRAETAVLVRCSSATGTPPSGIFILTRPAEPDARPRVAETLLSPEEGMSTKDFTVGERGARTIGVTLLGYSSSDVPRCCPDKRRTVKWEWRDGRFHLVPAPVAGSV